MSPSQRTPRVASWILAVLVGALGSALLIVLVNVGVDALVPELGVIEVHLGSHFAAPPEPREDPELDVFAVTWIAASLVAWLLVWWRLALWLRQHMLAGEPVAAAGETSPRG